MWKRPLAAGIAVSAQTFAPPPLWPMIVTLPGSPPKPTMLSRTHSSAATQSSIPTLPGRGELLAKSAGEVAIAERAEAVVDRDEHRVAEPREVLAVVAVVLDAVTVDEAAAVEPHEHRALLRVRERRGEDVQPQAVLAHVVVVPVVAERVVRVRVPLLHVLRRAVAPPQGREHLRPGLRLLRRHEAVGAGGVGAVRDAEEVVDAAEHVAAHLAVLRVGHGDRVADEEDRPVGGFRSGSRRPPPRRATGLQRRWSGRPRRCPPPERTRACSMSS